MRRVRLRDRLKYLFDGLVSRGTWVMLAGLAVATCTIVVIAASLIAATGSAPEGTDFFSLLWMGFMRTLDAGTIGGDTGSAAFLGFMLLATIGGVFIIGTFIGIINNGLEGRLDMLRQGRSLVLERDHTVILGWNLEVFTIVSELVIANESRKRGAAIVILAEEEKVKMERAIRERIPDRKNTRIICRSGSPVDHRDLAIVNPRESRSIIVLSDGDDPDISVIKTLLAIVNAPDRREGPYVIVAQITEPPNLDVVRMLGVRDRVMPILASEVIARVAAQTSRQVGLSNVYTELMNFDGYEIYFKHEDALTGVPFGDALNAFESCTLLGIYSPHSGVTLNPGMNTPFGSDDSAILIAEDDDRIQLSRTWTPNRVQAAVTVAPTTRVETPESVLILGWSCEAPTIVRELDNYVPRGSRVHVVAEVDDANCGMDSLSANLVNQRLSFSRGDIRDRVLLESLGASDYDHVIVLSYGHLGPAKADAITLVTLLHLRNIAERDETPFSIVSEMLDVRNRELAEATRVDDFIVSKHLISLMMAQLSENAALAEVFSDLFDAEGSEIYLRPVVDYVEPAIPTAMTALTDVARQRGEVFIGYRLTADSHDPGKGYGVHVNPDKSRTVTFAADDHIIVLAES